MLYNLFITPTDHLFRYNDLEPLENNPPKGHYSTLIVGTFNAAISGNNALWFYGRTENEFWSLFPRLLRLPSLHPVDRNETPDQLVLLWKEFCETNRIPIADIFKQVRGDLPNHSVEHLIRLQPRDYLSFDFAGAFAHCRFDEIAFTWKGMERGTLTRIKQQYIQFFQPQGSRIANFLTPSNSYSKPPQWKDEYF